MKSIQLPRFALLTLAVFAPTAAVHGQHAHINAGAVEAVAGSKLYFANGSHFAAESGYVVSLQKATNGPYAGNHHGAITFSALATTRDFGGPSLAAALPGSHLELVVESVAGPAGGSWGFWEGEDEEDGTVLTFAVPSGTVGGTNQFTLSETNGSPGVDPYGHVHGRINSATVPGLYTVGFRIIDTSHNGSKGAPLHQPSDPFLLHFQAGVTIARATIESEGLRLEFATAANRTYTLETATEPTAEEGGWTAIAEPLLGDDHLHAVTVPTSSAAGFFRLKVQ